MTAFALELNTQYFTVRSCRDDIGANDRKANGPRHSPRDTVGILVGKNSVPWATARFAIGVGPEARREI